MDTSAFLALVASCAPLVHPGTAHALVAAESSFNPNAIGVVGGVLDRQPRNTGEAIATARHLQSTGWNFSVGLGQINLRNFDRLGLSITSAFDPCQNLRAMQTVLAECHDRVSQDEPPQRALRRALSCYYSGNPVTGFRDGYVNRITSAARDLQLPGATSP
jgi:type IV secretion system protein VirB1